MNSSLQAKLENIPPGPGVYVYKDSSGMPIYIGKARSLRNRVRTYFQHSRNLRPQDEPDDKSIEDVEFIVTDTEGEALALENNLIKQHKPQYNILLRDDKTYPYIKLTVNEPYPRAMITRRVRKDGAYYAGPFFPGRACAQDASSLIERYFLDSKLHDIPIDGKRPRPAFSTTSIDALGPALTG